MHCYILYFHKIMTRQLLGIDRQSCKPEFLIKGVLIDVLNPIPKPKSTGESEALVVENVWV